MQRHFIAGALACFGSSLFGQSLENAVNQAQGTSNSIQNTLQTGNAQISSGSSISGDASTQSSLNTQNSVDGTQGLSGGAGVRNDTNLQNNLNAQSGKLNSNLNTQVQGQVTLDGPQRGNNVQQNPANAYGNNYQSNGNGAIQPQPNSRQSQTLQSGQTSTQGWTAGGSQNNSSMQNSSMQNGSMQNGSMGQSGNYMPSTNVQQSWSSQNAGRVYVLRFDASGREFICVDGRPVYFDNVASASNQGNANAQSQYRAGYGNYDSRNGQSIQDPSRGRNSQQPQQQSSNTGSNLQRDSQNSRSLEQNRSTEATKANEYNPPSLEKVGADKQSASSDIQTGIDTRSDINAKSDSAKPITTPAADTPPKP